jgi:anti-sigma B factor antagonist
MKFSLDTSTGITIGIAELSGRLDSQNSSALQKAFNTWQTKASFLVFDCSALDFVDSSGLGAIVGCLRKALEKEGELRLVGLTPKVAMVFSLTQAERLFSIFSNIGEAIASFAVPKDSQEKR